MVSQTNFWRTTFICTLIETFHSFYVETPCQTFDWLACWVSPNPICTSNTSNTRLRSSRNSKLYVWNAHRSKVIVSDFSQERISYQKSEVGAWHDGNCSFSDEYVEWLDNKSWKNFPWIGSYCHQNHGKFFHGVLSNHANNNLNDFYKTNCLFRKNRSNEKKESSPKIFCRELFIWTRNRIDHKRSVKGLSDEEHHLEWAFYKQQLMLFSFETDWLMSRSDQVTPRSV